MWEILAMSFPGPENIEILLYFESAHLLLSGSMPYVDFLWIYSPGLLLFMTYLVLATKTFLYFRVVYFCLLLVGLLIFWALLFQYGIKHRALTTPAGQLWGTLFVILLVLSVGKTFINIDIITVAITTYALISVTKGRSVWAWLSLGIAFALRPLALVFVPAMLFMQRQTLKEAASSLGVFVLPLILSFLPFGLWRLLLGFEQSVRHQLVREIQIESVPATIRWLLSFTGIETVGSVNGMEQAITISLVSSDELSRFIDLLVWLPLLFALFLIVKMWKYRFQNAHVFFGICSLLIVGLVIRHPVLSPQYLIWIWSPILLWLMSAKQLSRRLIVIILVLLGSVHLFTAWSLQFYATHLVSQLINFEIMPMSLIATRNILLVLLFCLIYRSVLMSHHQLLKNNLKYKKTARQLVRWR